MAKCGTCISICMMIVYASMCLDFNCIWLYEEDYPAGGRWSNKWVDLNRIQACDTSRYSHIQTYTDIYRQIHTDTCTVIRCENPIQAYIYTYKHIHAIWTNTDCYIRAYSLLYSCIFFVIFMHICSYCSYVCIFFAAKSLSRPVWAHMSTYAHIWTPICTYMHEYIQNTCMIHARYRHFFRCRCMLYVKADIIYVCICMYMYI